MRTVDGIFWLAWIWTMLYGIQVAYGMACVSAASRVAWDLGFLTK